MSYVYLNPSDDLNPVTAKLFNLNFHPLENAIFENS